MKSPLLIIAAISSLSALTSCEKETPTKELPPLPVTVANPELTKPLVYAEYPATLDTVSSIEVRARVQGILQKTHFKDGELVKKGKLLFEIEPETYQQAVVAAEADLTKAKAAKELAETNFNRLSLALQKNAIAKTDVDVAAAEVAQSAAAVQQAEAKVADSKLKLSYTKIYSPIDGRVSRDYVGVGNLVGYAEPTLLTTVIDDSAVQAYFEVPERRVLNFLAARNDEKTADRIKALKVRLKLADGRIYEKTGTIDFIENEVDSSTRTNVVRASFSNPDGQLAKGLFGKVGIPVKPDPSKPEVDEAIILPTEAILRDIAGSFVWIVEEDNTVARRGVTVGSSLPLKASGGVKKSVILSGLSTTDKVIVAGLQRAREGGKVAPEMAAETAPPETVEPK